MKPLAAALILLASAASAEQATYGAITLTGLTRNSWHRYPVGATLTMVCNVNGPDGFLSVRSGPGTDFAIERKLNRLAILEIDSSQRRGHWVRVRTAFRTHSKDGAPQRHKSLHVSGWAHDSYMCDFRDHY